MPFAYILVPLIVVALFLWITYQFTPLDQKTNRILNGAAVAVLAVWLLSLVGVLDPIFGGRM